MSLRFVYGRAGSGKTTWCLNEIKKSIAGGASHPIVLLVPEQFSFQAERDLISVLETGGILGTEVLSFRRLAFRIFNEAGGITYPHINSAGKCMIIYRLLDTMKGKLKFFSRSSGRRGFVRTVSDLITEFKRYNVSAEALESANSFLEDGAPLKKKLEEICLIYKGFEKMLASRYRDSDDDLSSAAAKLASADLYDGAEFWIEGFAGFTPQEFALVGGLMKKASRINICLCTDSIEASGGSEPSDIFAPVKRTCRKFIKIAEEYNININPAINLSGERPPRFAGSVELAHLERWYGACPFAAFREKTADISLFSAINIFSEIEAAAGEIIGLCRDRGMRWRDIAVAAGDLDAYGRLVETVFAEYGIPCFIDRKAEITDHPLIRYVLSMLDIFIENWSYESVFRYLRTGFAGPDRESIDRLENYVLACGIRGGKWTDGKPWDMGTDLLGAGRGAEEDEETAALEDINRTRFAVAGPLLEFRERTKGGRRAADFCEALFDFLCGAKVPESIEAAVERFRKEGRLSLASEYGQIWNMLMEAFDQIVEVMGDETASLEKFSEMLRTGLSEYKTGIIPAALDQVLVGSLERSRSHEIKALFILGVNDGVFPSKSVEEGILSDADRGLLDKGGIELASDTRTRAFDEQYLIYRALTTAGRYLRLSWPIADSEGRSRRPSMVVSRLRRLFPAVRETSNIIKPDRPDGEVSLLNADIPAFRLMVAAVRRKADGDDIDPLWSDVYCWFAGQEGWQARCRSVLFALSYKNIPQPVGSDKIASLYGNPLYSSISRLEKYSACPFAYYVQYGLNARERKVFRLSPPDIGTFMHSIIERFSLNLSQNGISWREFDREWCRSEVSNITDDMIGSMRGSGLAGSKRYTALALRLKRVVTRSLWLVAEHIRRGSFDPVGFEVAFGEDAEFPPIEIELAQGREVRLTGRIDRVDAFQSEEGTYFRIVDYKSGSRDFKLSDIYHGLQLQLITYMDAILGSGTAGRTKFPSLQGKKGPVLFGGMLYFRVDDPYIRESGNVSDEDIEKAIMRQLKMKGLLPADVRLIREMDNSIDGTSLFLPARINKGDVLGRSSAASSEQFYLLRAHTGRLLRNLCGEVLKGNVSISPYRKKKATSCDFCSFSSICQFDTARSENTFRQLQDKEDEEVWGLMRAAGQGE